MKILGLIALVLLMMGCSDSDDDFSSVEVDSSNYSAFPALPTSTSETVELTGAMTWWFWEGDGGCFGTISDGRQSIELHAEADLCEPIEYEEGQEASIKITFDPSKQYSPDNQKMFSIIKFIK